MTIMTEAAAENPRPVGGPSPRNRETESIAHLLKSDHQAINHIWEDATQQREDNPGGSLESYRKFVASLENHIRMEELLLFPSQLRFGEPGTRPLIESLRREHEEIRGFLDVMWMSLINGQFPSDKIERQLLPLIWQHDEREDAIDCSYFERRQNEPDIREISGQIRMLVGRLGGPSRTSGVGDAAGSTGQQSQERR